MAISRATPFLGIPFDAPRSAKPRVVLDEVKAGLDFVAHNLPKAHDVLVRLNPYPEPWRAVRLDMRDGAQLAAWHGPGEPGRPAVLFVPGTFQTKDDTPRKRRALQMWRRHGAHVLILDLRGFGGSHAHPGSGGHLEAQDLHEAADWLIRTSGAPKVILWGESLGGAASLLAASLSGAADRFERVVAWSPFCDLADAMQAGSLRSRRGRTLIGRAYRWLLRTRTRNQVRDFREYLALRARVLDMSLDELVHRGSPLRHVGGLAVDAYVFHAEDDPVVPVSHARRFVAAAAERLHVHILPAGGHVGFDLVAPAWFQAILDGVLAPGQPQAP